LQRLPDRKAGTTTAAEVAKLLGGEFLDVTKQGGGTVAQRIYAALQKTIRDLQGKVEVAKTGDGGFADFGVIEGTQAAQAEVPVVSRSCYGEQITAVTDVTARLSDAERESVRRAFIQWQNAGRLKNSDNFKHASFANGLPTGALSVQLQQPVLLKPTIDQVAQGGTVWQPMKVTATIGRTCPPGAYLGAFKVDSTAHCDALVGYAIAVPSRIVTDTAAVSARVKKESGVCWTKPTSTELKFSVGTSLASQQTTVNEISVEPDEARGENGAVLKTALINGGRPADLKLKMTEAGSEPVRLLVDVPADQPPGTYKGKIHLKVKDAANVLAPADLQYTVEILPSPWEQVRPIAVPILALFGVVLLLWFGIWLASNKN
jgi:hypothetical protein